MSDTEALRVDGLTVHYGDTLAVDDVSFSLPTGCIAGIVGPNGAGKSSLIKAIVGAKAPSSGLITIDGVPAEQNRGDMTYVPQRGDVDWDFPITARQVVEQGRYNSAGFFGWFFGDDDRRSVQEAMEDVDITDLADRQIGALSGGQKQRVFLARALAQGGDLFLMDEPFAGVDAATESAIIDVLRKLADDGKTVVVVHHDLMTVRQYFDQVVLLNTELIAAGPTRDTFSENHLRATYGGRVAIVSGESPQRSEIG